MAIRCPNCGAQYDVTLFTFDRRLHCDCGAWVDLSVGHQETGEVVKQAPQEVTMRRRRNRQGPSRLGPALAAESVVHADGSEGIQTLFEDHFLDHGFPLSE
jgi:hypothetical protein